MGGIGSGRRRHFSVGKSVEDYRSIDVRRWNREGLLSPGGVFSWNWACNGEVTGSIQVRVGLGYVILTYRFRSGGMEWHDTSNTIELDETSCHLGGTRRWFLCPGADCKRRVAILYGGAPFACRHCYQLTYTSQREHFSDRAVRRAGQIRNKLGWTPGLLNDLREGRPKGMHSQTYERLRAEYKECEQIFLADILQRFGIKL